ncbi:MAG TPA: hypothetical protein PK213_13245 [Deltaproteobacteria bacterium]|jgi:predicted nucleic acid-binding protein|nr:hypothetical protein [Deltaproteobacteria bacterium]
MKDELLPFFEVIEIREEAAGVCKSSDNDIFLATAVNTHAPHLVTGDKDLLDLKKYKYTRILTPREYLDMKRS